MKKVRINPSKTAAQYLTGDMDTEGTVLFRITKREIETLSTDRLVAFLHPDCRGLSGLSYLMGNITVILPETSAIHGEPFLCEQTRQFCRLLHAVFPYWGFFFSTNSMSLWKLSLGLLQNTRVLQYQRSCETRFALTNDEIEFIVDSHIQGACTVAEMALIPEASIKMREAALRDYFDRLMAAHTI